MAYEQLLLQLVPDLTRPKNSWIERHDDCIGFNKITFLGFSGPFFCFGNLVENKRLHFLKSNIACDSIIDIIYIYILYYFIIIIIIIF